MEKMQNENIFGEAILLNEEAKEILNRIGGWVIGFESAEKEKTMAAVTLALKIHADQRPRPDGPYVNHILRVTERVINEFGVADPEVVQAAALHDSVEDQASKLASFQESEVEDEAESALVYLNEQFGDRVVKIVSAVTNPDFSEELNREEVNELYVEHVREVIADPDVFYVKLSDFSDNGLNLRSVADPARQHKLAKKYLPLYQIFSDRLQQDDIVIPTDKKSEILDRIKLAKTFAESVG